MNYTYSFLLFLILKSFSLYSMEQEPHDNMPVVNERLENSLRCLRGCHKEMPALFRLRELYIKSNMPDKVELVDELYAATISVQHSVLGNSSDSQMFAFSRDKLNFLKDYQDKNDGNLFNLNLDDFDNIQKNSFDIIEERSKNSYLIQYGNRNDLNNQKDILQKLIEESKK